MTIGERIESRRKAIGIPSQSALARRAKVGQSTLNGLIRNPYRWSPYLTQIARALRTSVEYLNGDVDDPEAGVPPIPDLSHDEWAWVEYWRALESDEREAMVRVVRLLIGNHGSERAQAA